MKTKRLLALTLALVLALGVWPMVALGAATDSAYFSGWQSNGSFQQLSTSAGSNSAWNCNVPQEYPLGILVADTGSIATSVTTGTLFIAKDKVLTIGSGGNLTVDRIIFLDSTSTTSSVVVEQAGKLTVNGALFDTPAASGKVTIKPMSYSANTLNANPASGITNSAINAGNTNDKLYDYSIAVATNPVEITGYNQTAGSSLTGNVNVTFKGTSSLAGTVNLGSADVNVDGAGTLTLNLDTAKLTVGKVNATGNLAIGPDATLAFTDGNDVIGAKLDVYGNLTLTDSNGDAVTGLTTVKSGGTLTVNNTADTTFTGGLTVDQGGTLVMEDDIIIGTGGVALTVNGIMNVAEAKTLTLTSASASVAGTLNVNEILTTTGGPLTIANGGVLNTYANLTNGAALTIANGGTMNVKNNTTLGAGAFTVDGTVNVDSTKTLTIGAGNLEVGSTSTAPGKLYVKGELDLAGNNVTVGDNGLLDFDTVGVLSADSPGSVITLQGLIRMANPAGTSPQLAASSANLSITSTPTSKKGTIATNDESGFGGVAKANVNFVPFLTPMPSYADTLISNTPVMAPVSTTYPGYGVFVISSTGFFKDFDPDKSLYANGVKMEVGVDYDVVNKGGYAQFNIYESFMQTLNGPVVFKATFISGKVSSATVSVQGVAIPDDITASAPKTGDNGSMLGVAIVMMALAMAVVAKKVRA